MGNTRCNYNQIEQNIEGYLAHKWGLTSNLPSSHPHSLGHPIDSSGSPIYITDTPFGSGKAIDLANGHVEIPTGETEDVFDGGNAFSVSAWVKGWPQDFGGPIISKGGEIPSPANISGLTLWLTLPMILLLPTPRALLWIHGQTR